ncbi:MAG TPA: hypothetical protein VHI52_12505, partial [Verrucomicrobiae bacterium]|nr:hypothetical protein [Verrucomicrobiae bacterium]
MRLLTPGCGRPARGYILILTIVMLAISLIMVSSLYVYSQNTSKLNQRNSDYYTSVSAAEAATEKVLSQMTSDFRDYGDGYLQEHLDNYRRLVPTSGESALWNNFDFMDQSGQQGRVQVDWTTINGFSILGGQYGPLRGFTDRVRILSNARINNSGDGVVGSVYQDISLTRIPIFQYAIFYNVVLEFTPLPPMNEIGLVHCNTNIYMNPAGTLTFYNDVTSSGTIVTGKNPVGPLPALGGGTSYLAKHDSGVSTLSLPIGTNNTPSAVQQVLMVPPTSEDPESSMGQQRYYNKADLILLVQNNAIIATNGLLASHSFSVPTNELFLFVSTNGSFYNKREAKTIRPIQIDIGKLVLWNATNASVRPNLPLSDVRVIYVADQRTFSSSYESGVRLVNGATLPPQGLTVATPSPLYIWGDYNAPASAKGTTNTTATLPASVAADAVTVLSTAWNDANSSLALALRIAGDTTV